MGPLEQVFGNPVALVGRVLTYTTAGLAKPLLVTFFASQLDQRRREELGRTLVAAGEALGVGKVTEAADALACVIGEICG